MATERKHVIVLGAGISGLSAAKLLTESNLDVTVLEATDRVGGRTYTKREKNYGYVDLGGAYVGPTQDRILRLAKELNVKTYRLYSDGAYIHYFQGKPIKFFGAWPRFWNPFAWLDVNNLFRKIDSLAFQIPPEAPWKAPKAKEWDQMTMQQFFDKTCWTRAAKEFGRATVNTNVTMEPWEVSMLWYLWYMRSGQGSERIWEITNGSLERKFLGGSQQISERIAEKLQGKIMFKSPAEKISHDDQGVKVITADQKVFEADYAIVAFAPSLQLSMTFDPPLPPRRAQLIQRVPMGSCIKNQTWYNSPFWRAKGLNGYGTVADGKSPVGNIVDDCKPGSSVAALTGFIMADRARELANATREERQRATCEWYAQVFETNEALEPIAYEEFNWCAQPYSGGCYTSTFPPGVLTQFGRELRKPIGRIYFAGTETATRWSGYMDGAVEAGERAAREVMCHLGMIPFTEIWQEEPESEEVPPLPIKKTYWERHAPSVGQCLYYMAGTGIAVLVAYLLFTQRGKITIKSARRLWKTVIKSVKAVWKGELWAQKASSKFEQWDSKVDKMMDKFKKN